MIFEEATKSDHATTLGSKEAAFKAGTDERPANGAAVDDPEEEDGAGVAARLGHVPTHSWTGADEATIELQNWSKAEGGPGLHVRDATTPTSATRMQAKIAYGRIRLCFPTGWGPCTATPEGVDITGMSVAVSDSPSERVGKQNSGV